MKNVFVPLEKMTKKKKREYYKRQRRDWGEISPVTRCPDDPKAYNRSAEKKKLAAMKYDE